MHRLYIELLIYIQPSWVFLSAVNIVVWPPWLSRTVAAHIPSWKNTLWTSSVNSRVDGLKICQIFHNNPPLSFLWCALRLFQGGCRWTVTSCGIQWGGTLRPSQQPLWCSPICIKQYLHYKYQMKHMNDACLVSMALFLMMLLSL